MATLAKEGKKKVYNLVYPSVLAIDVALGVFDIDGVAWNPIFKLVAAWLTFAAGLIDAGKNWWMLRATNSTGTLLRQF